MDEFVTKDSGARQLFASGMQRDITTGKVQWRLVYSGPMLARWAGLLTRGAEKYDADNWMKASGREELDRFRDSAARHFAQWMAGETDEDHAAAVFFNINGAEYVKSRLAATDDGVLATRDALLREQEQFWYVNAGKIPPLQCEQDARNRRMHEALDRLPVRSLGEAALKHPENLEFVNHALQAVDTTQSTCGPRDLPPRPQVAVDYGSADDVVAIVYWYDGDVICVREIAAEEFYKFGGTD